MNRVVLAEPYLNSLDAMAKEIEHVFTLAWGGQLSALGTDLPRPILTAAEIDRAHSILANLEDIRQSIANVALNLRQTIEGQTNVLKQGA